MADVHLVRIVAMDGDAAAGEASDFDSIQEDGIVPSDGGFVTSVSVNANGSDGLLSSLQLDANGTFLSSVEVFDQATGQIVRTVAQGLKFILFGRSRDAPVIVALLFNSITCPPQAVSWQSGVNPTGIFANDVGLYGSTPVAQGASTSFYALKPVTTGVPQPWVPPLASFGSSNVVAASAANQSIPTVAFMATENQNAEPQWWFTPNESQHSNVFTWNSVEKTFSPVHDMGASCLFPAIGQDTSTNTAVFEGYGCGSWSISALGQLVSQTPLIQTVNLASGATASFPASGEYFAPSLGGIIPVDSKTHLAFLNQGSGLVYNIAHPADDITFSFNNLTGALNNALKPLATPPSLGTGYSRQIYDEELDAQHGLVLYSMQTALSFYGTGNFNSMNYVAVSNEQGQGIELLPLLAQPLGDP